MLMADEPVEASYPQTSVLLLAPQIAWGGGTQPSPCLQSPCTQDTASGSAAYMLIICLAKPSSIQQHAPVSAGTCSWLQISIASQLTSWQG